MDPIEITINLLKGLGITLRQMFSRPCTVQYPEERLAWPERSRGRLVMPRDAATGRHRCTACLICQKICPNGSIEVTTQSNTSGKRELADYLLYLDRCTFCGLCVEACPFDALRFSHEHEIAVRDKRALQLHLQQETLGFSQDWRGGLPAKADPPQAGSETAKETGA